MKKLLLGFGSFVAATAPVAAVVACGSSKTTNTADTSGTGTGGTGVTPPSNGSSPVTNTELHNELANIKTIHLDSSPVLKDMKPGDLIALIKLVLNDEIGKNAVLASNSTEINRSADVKFKLDGSKIMFQWQAQGTLNPTGFYETEITGLDVSGLTGVGKQIMLTLQSSKSVKLIDLLRTTVNDSNTSVYVSSISIKDSTTTHEATVSNGDWSSTDTGATGTITIPSGETIVEYMIKTYIPQLTDASTAKIQYEVVSVSTATEQISLTPITW